LVKARAPWVNKGLSQLVTSQSRRIMKIALWPWKCRSRSLIVELFHDLIEMHLWGKFEPPELRTFRVNLMTSQSRQNIENSVTLKNRSRSLTIDFCQSLIAMHLWWKFEHLELKTFQVTLMTSKSGQIFEVALWPQKIGQGHWQMNFAKVIKTWICGKSLKPLSQNIFSHLDDKQKWTNREITLWPAKIGQSHW